MKLSSKVKMVRDAMMMSQAAQSYKLQVVLEPCGVVQVVTGVNRSSTVKQLKHKIESMMGIPSFLVELYYLDECALVDDEPLHFYHILPDARSGKSVFTGLGTVQNLPYHVPDTGIGKI